MLAANDLKNALIFLNRVDIKGHESMAHAELTMKLQAMQQALTMPVPDTPTKDQIPPLKEIGADKK